MTKQINQLRNTPAIHIWQRNYFEHIIRNDEELKCIREYIINNPLKWQFDKENPKYLERNKDICNKSIEQLSINYYE